MPSSNNRQSNNLSMCPEKLDQHTMPSFKEKTFSFFADKFFPILLLWVAIGFAVFVGGDRWSLVFSKADSGKAVIEAVTDTKILLLYLAGMAVLLLIFSVGKQMGWIAKEDDLYSNKFFEDLWGEFVGITVHASCGLLLLWKLDGAQDTALLWKSLGLGLIACLFFRHAKPLQSSPPTSVP